MTDFIFNTAKGQDKTYFSNVNDNTPANSAITLVLLQASEADSALRDYANLSLLLAAGGNTEATFTNYARKELTDTDSITVTVDNGADTLVIDIPDQVWASAGGTSDNTLAKLLVCYDSDTTGGDDTNIVPVYAYDFVATTNGENLEARPAAGGLSSQ